MTSLDGQSRGQLEQRRTISVLSVLTMHSQTVDKVTEALNQSLSIVDHGSCTKELFSKLGLSN